MCLSCNHQSLFCTTITSKFRRGLHQNLPRHQCSEGRGNGKVKPQYQRRPVVTPFPSRAFDIHRDCQSCDCGKYQKLHRGMEEEEKEKEGKAVRILVVIVNRPDVNVSVIAIDPWPGAVHL
ncbi:hypothetical protein E2C01_051207 [Portunus trituberculatus]|uniref:Uncharacterized protein n=1 Tax=Portunus trituberculatus TaxID=210409 RepID=A0A5B7GAC8_PORTR|nr:hypothetical protein [Portunus trituberculatus]